MTKEDADSLTTIARNVIGISDKLLNMRDKLAMATMLELIRKSTSYGLNSKDIARRSYEMADAMLAVRGNVDD